MMTALFIWFNITKFPMVYYTHSFGELPFFSDFLSSFFSTWLFPNGNINSDISTKTVLPYQIEWWYRDVQKTIEYQKNDGIEMFKKKATLWLMHGKITVQNPFWVILFCFFFRIYKISMRFYKTSLKFQYMFPIKFHRQYDW